MHTLKFIFFFLYLIYSVNSYAQLVLPRPHIFTKEEIKKYKIKSIKRIENGWTFSEEYDKRGQLLSFVQLTPQGSVFVKEESKVNNNGELIETTYYHKEGGEGKSRTLFYSIEDSILVKKHYYIVNNSDDSSVKLRYTIEKYNLRKKIIKKEYGTDGVTRGVVIEYSYFPSDTLKEETEYYTSNIELGKKGDSVRISNNKKFNKFGKLLFKTSLGNGSSTEYYYLNDTLPLKEVYQRFEDGFEQTRKWEYDKNNRLLKEYYIDVENGEELITLSLKYNSKGDTIEKKTDTQLFSYEYIPSVRKEKIFNVLYDDYITCEIWRDSHLRIIKSIHYNNGKFHNSSTFKYDKKGRMIEEYYSNEENDIGQLFKRFEYDNEGNMIYFGQYQDNKIRKETRKLYNKGKLVEEYDGTYGRDSLTEKHVYKYDEKMKIVRQEMWKKNKPVFFYDFQYDKNDNIIKAVNTDYFKVQAPEVTTYQYTYNEFNFLIKKTITYPKGSVETENEVSFEYY